jgi:ankyrin repeat domain-containing protein 50
MREELRDIGRHVMKKRSEFGLEVCEQQLLKSVDLYPQTTLVLDALDECDERSQGRLMKELNILLSKAKKPLRIFISSRPEQAIRHYFDGKRKIEILAKDNRDDIAKFIDERIVQHRRWVNMPLELREDIKQTLLDKTDGM